MLVKVHQSGARIDDPIDDVLQRSEGGDLLAADLVDQLLAGSLFILQHPEANLSDADVDAGRISLGVQQVGGRKAVAVYSSQEAIERLTPEGSAYVGIPASALLGMWGPDDWLMLNPRARYQLVMSPGEIGAILRGDSVCVEVGH